MSRKNCMGGSRLGVTVIGCGVIGLTAAIRIQEAGLDAGIRTAALPRDTNYSARISGTRAAL